MKTNILLLAGVVCLSLILYYEPGLQLPDKKYLTPLNSEKIQFIYIQRKGLESIELNKTAAGWFMTQPLQIAANPLRIGTITALAEKRSFSQFPAQDKSLKKYHLDDPLITVRLDNTDIAIGGEDPVNQRRYALIDNTIHLINGKIYYQLRANLDTFISLSLLPPEADIKTITFPDWTLNLKQAKWQLSPDMPDVSSDSISALLQSWKTAQALRIKTSPISSMDEESSTELNNESSTELNNESSTELNNESSTGLDKKSSTGLDKKSATTQHNNNLISITLQDESQIQYRLTGDARTPELIRLPWKITYYLTPQTMKQLNTFTNSR